MGCACKKGRSHRARRGSLGASHPDQMRCGTFTKTHGREAEKYVASGHIHLDRECDVTQAKAMLDGAAMHRKWMMEKARECEAAGRKIDRAAVARVSRSLVGKIRGLTTRIRRPCVPKYGPVQPLDLPSLKLAIKRSQTARQAKGKR